MIARTANGCRFIFILTLTALLTGCDQITGLLNPKGVITFVERKIFFDTTALMLVVVIPVIIMSIDFIYHYRSENHEKKITGRNVEYKPEWAHSTFLESLWWGVPCTIILVLALITWFSTHKLDPYREIHYPGEKLQIQVVALPWKWLFIYPEQNIATVNHLIIPHKKQVEFFLTTDNVAMSAFFVPQLGSQIYTMAGMQTKLHLVATHLGRIEGFNSQYNGSGFSDMRFNVDVLEDKEFNNWIRDVKRKKRTLSKNEYRLVRQASIKEPPHYYARVQQNLFNQIIHSYQSYEHPNA